MLVCFRNSSVLVKVDKADRLIVVLNFYSKSIAAFHGMLRKPHWVCQQQSGQSQADNRAPKCGALALPGWSEQGIQVKLGQLLTRKPHQASLSGLVI